MRRFSYSVGTKAQGVILGTLLILWPFGRPLVGDALQPTDPCEVEAVKAYRQALEYCQLAEISPSNPRLRCYEAAKAVYIQTLQECHGRR